MRRLLTVYQLNASEGHSVELQSLERGARFNAIFVRRIGAADFAFESLVLGNAWHVVVGVSEFL